MTTMKSRSKIVCKEWLYVPKSRVDLNRLVITRQDYFGREQEPLILYENKGDYVGVPRYFLKLKKYPPVKGKWERVELKHNIKLRPYQKDVLIQYAKAVKTKAPYGGIIQMPTGTGKTVVGLYLATLLKYRTLIVVHTEILYEQWKRAVKEFLGMEVGEIRQEKEDLRPVTIAMIQTLLRKKEVPYKEYFGHVIYDEVHILGAEKFNQTVTLFNPRFRTGLTATPHREDRMENLFFWHIGPIIAKTEATLLTPKVLKIEFNSPLTSTKDCFINKRFIKSRFLKKLNIPRRNKIVAQLALKAYKKGYKVLILSDILELLYEYNKLIDVPDKAWVIGEKKTYTGKERIILGTYQASGIGFDAPDIDCLILATPRTSVKQAIGRVLRISEHKRQPIIVDIVDNFSPLMRNYFTKRSKDYEGCKIKIIKL